MFQWISRWFTKPKKRQPHLINESEFTKPRQPFSKVEVICGECKGVFVVAPIYAKVAYLCNSCASEKFEAAMNKQKGAGNLVIHREDIPEGPPKFTMNKEEIPRLTLNRGDE
jgi:hypothetical protein